MKPDVAHHPQYPFRTELLRTLPDRALSFVDGPEPGSSEHALLGEFLGLIHAYAFLERLVQGTVLCELPVHVDRILTGFLDPEDEGERLATQEAALLDWTPESADSLVDALDELGVKVLCRDDPTDGEAPPGPRLGAFAFEGDAGPAILVGASPHTPEAAFIAAHGLAHLVADVDPYLPRMCRWDSECFANLSDRPEEVRADRFARALLMPRDAFLEAIRELGANPADDADPRPEQLAALFGVPYSLVIQRLADLELPPPGPSSPPCGPATGGSTGAVPPGRAASSAPDRGSAAASAEASLRPDEEEPADEPVDEPVGSLTLPERFVNLSLAAYAGRVLDLEGLSRFLRISPPGAQRMADLAGITPEPEEDETP